MNRIILTSALLALSLPAQEKTAAPQKNIVETAIAAGSFGTLATALKAGGLVEALQGKGPFTVFAPTDAAFAKIPEETLAKLLKPKNRDKLVSILTYHVVPGNVPASVAVKTDFAKTLNGQRAGIEVSKKGAMIAGAKIVKTDIHCSNGIIHVIDSVMMPSQDNIVTTAKKTGRFKTLLAAAEAAGLAKPLMGKGPFTVFAPTDAAFDKLPEGTVASLLRPDNKSKLAAILEYHIVSGRVYSQDLPKWLEAATRQGGKLRIAKSKKGVMVNGASVVMADIDTSNGVIHVIDGVVLPSAKADGEGGKN